MKGPRRVIIAKLGSSLLVVVLLAPILALSMIAGGRVRAIAESNGNEWLLIALAFGGAAASALNGLGRSIRRSQARNYKPALVNRSDIQASAVHLR